MNEQETSADIIAEMRMFKCRNLETGELELCNAIGNYFADRIEAALKREKAAIEADALAVGGVVAAIAEKSSVVGDAAKLREVLEATLDLFWDMHYENRSPQSNQAYAVIKQIKAALAEPPRNCDMYSESRCAYMFDAIYKGPRDGVCVVRTKREKNIHLYYMGLCKWLFAHATEKEGGAK